MNLPQKLLGFVVFWPFFCQNFFLSEIFPPPPHLGPHRSVIISSHESALITNKYLIILFVDCVTGPPARPTVRQAQLGPARPQRRSRASEGRQTSRDASASSSPGRSAFREPKTGPAGDSSTTSGPSSDGSGRRGTTLPGAPRGAGGGASRRRRCCSAPAPRGGVFPSPWRPSSVPMCGAETSEESEARQGW